MLMTFIHAVSILMAETGLIDIMLGTFGSVDDML